MDTIRERDSNLFDRLAYTDTYATSTMKPKLYKQEETQVNDQSSRSSTSISRKSHTSASFFDRLAHTETYATQQTRKQNRGKNDGTFAETSKNVLMRDFKGGTYFHGKMDPATERRKSSKKPGELRKSLNKPLRNQEFYDRMTYHETYASAQTRKQAREESDGSTFAEANKGALMRDYKGSTMFRANMDPAQERRKLLAEEEKKRKAIQAKKLKNQSFYERMANHETYASAQTRKQAREESDGSTFAEANKGALMRDYKGSTMIRANMDPAQERRKLLAEEEKKRKAIQAKKLKNQSFYERMANHETYASAQTRKQAREKQDADTFAEANKGALMRDYKGSTMLRPGMDPAQERRKLLAEEEKKRKAIHAKKLKNQSFFERMVHHETYASAQLRKQNKDTDSASTLAESVKKASLRDFDGSTQMDPRNVVRKKKPSERKVSLEPAKNQDFFERMAKHDTYASSTMKPKLQEKRKPLGKRNANLM
ncbi:predicted protein [Chaetoceros tenuissimus]|uniref:Uncharacterized protein n=1 Tax=Chaetoceros tenuissimus TaxID=426638 RepID=A0AAD3GZX1_9STRA|nr:predicted protein [Chaetoceros tenuissimus]